MKAWRKFLLVAVTVISFGLPATAHSIVYVVCRKFVAEKGCYKCSSYFSTQSEDQAQKKCARMGTANPTILVPFRPYSVGCCPTAIAVTTKINRPGSLPVIYRTPAQLQSANLTISGGGPLTTKWAFSGKPEFVNRISEIGKFYPHKGIEPSLVVKFSRMRSDRVVSLVRTESLRLAKFEHLFGGASKSRRDHIHPLT